ncbi:MAG: N-acetylmuramoyl-L-alanine amidase [Bacteroides sp.]|nr:N-acetylmuramoyl-L-alanine amidase [Bacteroides sp.]
MNKIYRLLLLLLLALPTAAQEKAERAEPKAGEGITAFLLRHGRKGKACHEAFLELNKTVLRGKEELRLGVSYLLPPLEEKGGKAEADAPRTRQEPLFGQQLKQVDITGNRLKGACFYIVSGHGGPDPGAIGYVGGRELHEDEYAYDIALRLGRNLMQQGAEVRIIIQDKKDGIRDDKYLKNSKRETCMGQAIPLNQVERLQQRCATINELYRKDKKKFSYCRAIFLHVDSRSKNAQVDVFFYHAPGSDQGEQLATRMKKTFESKYDKHQPNRGFEGTVSERNLYVLRSTAPVALFVELGNIQNSFDQRRFVISSNRQALAKWMTEGFITDFSDRK